MPNRWTRRSVGFGLLALSSGCLRADLSSEAQTGDGSDDGTNDRTPTESTAGGSAPADATFGFRYTLAGFEELRVGYVSGPPIAAADLRVTVGGTAVPWTALGERETVKPEQTVTLTGDAEGVDWPLAPATPVTVAYTGEEVDEPAPLARFNTGGSAAVNSVTPSNTGRNANVVGANRAERAWERSVGRIIRQPAIRDGVVYFGTYDRLFYAKSLADGETLWTFDAPAPDVAGDDATIAATPAVTDDAVYLGAGNSAVGFRLDRASGEVQWKSEDVGMYSPTVSDGTVYVGGGSGVVALDAETGDVEWHRGIGWVAEGAVAVADRRVVAAVDTGIVCLSADTGDEEWVHFDESIENPPNPAVDDGTVYAVGGEASGRLIALDLEDGSKQWQYDTTFDRIDHSPVVGPETVVVLSKYDDSSPVAVQRNGDGERWSGGNSSAVGGVASHGSLYYTSQSGGGVTSSGLATGRGNWRSDTTEAAEITTPPAVAEGFVVFGRKVDDDHRLVALRERA